MNQKQWQQPEIKEINIKNTESGDYQIFGEGVWHSNDPSKPPITTSS